MAEMTELSRSVINDIARSFLSEFRTGKLELDFRLKGFALEGEASTVEDCRQLLNIINDKHFLFQLDKTMKSGVFAVSLSHLMDKREKDTLRKHLKSSVYLWLLRHHIDASSQVYYIFRSEISTIFNFLGWDSVELTAEVDWENIFDGFSNFFSSLFGLREVPAEGFLNSLRQKITNYLNSFSIFMTGILRSIFDFVLDKLWSVIVFICAEMFEKQCIARVGKPILTSVLLGVGIVLILLLANLGIVSVITLRFFLNTLRSTCSKFGIEPAGDCDEFVGEFEVPTNSRTLFSYIYSLPRMIVGGLNAVDRRSFREVCLTITAGAAAGAIGYKTFQVLFGLLPLAFRQAFVLRYGTTTQRNQLVIDNWFAMCTTLLRANRIPQVVGSKIYYQKIVECYNLGHNMRDMEMNRMSRAMYCSNMVSIRRIVSALSCHHEYTVDRIHPYSLHLFSRPGCGKTLVHTKLIRDITNLTDIYHRNYSDSYWSSYMGQKAIVLDEFCVGNRDEIGSMASEYLSLVGTATFKPPMPSLEDFACGIKGVEARPEIVLTMNNHHFVPVAGLDDEALKRRRHHVIKIISQPKYNIRNMDAGQRNSLEWMRFAILDPMHGNENYRSLTYSELVAILAHDFQQHLRVSKELLYSLHGQEQVVRDPVEILNEFLSEDLGAITRIPTFQEMMGNLFSDGTNDYFEKIQLVDGQEPMIAEGPGGQEHWHRRRRKRETAMRAEGNGQPIGKEKERIELGDSQPSAYSSCQEESDEIEPMFKENGNESPYEGPLENVECILECADKELTYDAYMVFDYARERLRGLLEGTWKTLTAVAVVTGAAVFLSSMIASRFAGEDEVIAEAGGASVWREKTAVKKLRRNQFRRGDDFSAEGATNNVVTIKIGQRVVRGLGLNGRSLITYLHAFEDENGDIPNSETTLTIQFAGKEYTEKFVAHNLLLDDANDVAVYSITSRSFPCFKDIRRKFLSHHEISVMGNPEVQMVTERGTLFGKGRLEHNRSYTSNGKRRTLEDCIIVNMNTMSGDCGTPLQVASGAHIGKFLGLHVAGTLVKTTRSFGLSTIISRETIEAIAQVDDQVIEDTVEFAGESAVDVLRTLPNSEWVEEVPRSERVFLTTKTKLRPSLLSHVWPIAVKKEPAILNAEDERGDGSDPILNNVTATLDTVNSKEVDEELLEGIFETMRNNFERDLVFDAGKRELTFEEACGGVPGILNSINVSTSPGWPLILTRKKPGKKDYVWFDQEGKMCYDPWFRDQVEYFVKQMEQGEMAHHVWLGYLKDELRSRDKVAVNKTRVIYCGDMIATVAFRMKFGAVLVAFSRSNTNTSLSIGLNQFSYDMDQMYNYLTSLGGDVFIAGDYKGFDQHYHLLFRSKAYELLLHFARSYGVSQVVCDGFYHHETESPAQIGELRFKARSNHMSGCFFTTIINCLMNEAYHRYCFAREFPKLLFDCNVRLKVLGDDHVLCVSKDLGYTGTKIQKRMLELGQIYTSDLKTEEIPDFVRFDEITFLGAHPRLVNGLWSGAMKKDILEQTVCWTRDNDDSIDLVNTALVEYCSQWDREYFDYYARLIDEARKKVGLAALPMAGYQELRRVVAFRTASEGGDFPILFAQGPDSVFGLTTFQTEREQVVHPGVSDMHDKSLAEKDMSLDFASKSFVFRNTFQWSTTDAVGAVLSAYDELPSALLSESATNNIQNMPFERFVYWHGDIELAFQVNGTPFQQGMLCVYFYPLSSRGSLLQLESITSCHHVTLSPDNSTTTTLRIPFRFPRYMINTFATGSNNRDTLGSVVVRVLSPLRSVDPTSVTVTVYSSFPDSSFSLPRPVTATLGELEFVAEGQGSSKITNNYNISDVAGNVPIEAGAQKTGIETAADVSAIPMDNPPIASGSVPIHMHYSSISKTNGLEPTTMLSLHPEQMAREHRDLMSPHESNIQWLCERRGLFSRVLWDTSQAVNTNLLTFQLNSILGTAEFSAIPPNMAILNMFMFFRCDFEFEFVAVRTKFHSGRLKLTVGYGAPSIGAGSENVFFNQVLDFKGDSDRCTVLIPYNQATEFIRTFEGPDSIDVIQDYSLGLAKLTVANQLVATTTVAQQVELLCFVRFRNVKVVMPRPRPFLTMPGLTSMQFVAPSGSADFIGEGPGMLEPGPVDVGVDHTMVQKTAQQDLDPTSDTTHKNMDNIRIDSGVPMTTPQNTVPYVQSCRLNLGSKFEYIVGDLVELARRGTLMPPPATSSVFGSSSVEAADLEVNDANVGLRKVVVAPFTFLNNFFAAWAGSMRYRVLKASGNSSLAAASMPVMFVPFTIKDLAFNDVQSTQLDRIACEGIVRTGASTTTAIVQTDAFLEGITGLKYYYPYGFPPQEQTFTNGGQEYIDVTIPFWTHFNFAQNQAFTQDQVLSENTTSGSYIGVLMFATETDNGAEATKVYSSVGDDFNYGIFRPPLDLVWSPSPNAIDSSFMGLVNFAGYNKVIS